MRRATLLPSGSIRGFVGILMNLVRVGLALKVVQFLDWQAVEKLDPAFDLKGRLQEMLMLLLLSALERHRIIDAPVSADRGAWKSRTPLAGIVGKGDDEIKILVGKLLPGICNRAAGIYLEIFAKNFQGKRVHFPCRSFPGAPDFEAVAAERAKQILGQDASLRVTSAEKQNTKR